MFVEKLAKKKRQKNPLQSMLECIQSLENFLITCKLDNIIIIMCFISPPLLSTKRTILEKFHDKWHTEEVLTIRKIINGAMNNRAFLSEK